MHAARHEFTAYGPVLLSFKFYPYLEKSKKKKHPAFHSQQKQLGALFGCTLRRARQHMDKNGRTSLCSHWTFNHMSHVLSIFMAAILLSRSRVNTIIWDSFNISKGSWNDKSPDISLYSLLWPLGKRSSVSLPTLMLVADRESDAGSVVAAARANNSEIIPWIGESNILQQKQYLYNQKEKTPKWKLGVHQRWRRCNCHSPFLSAGEKHVFTSSALEVIRVRIRLIEGPSSQNTQFLFSVVLMTEKNAKRRVRDKARKGFNWIIEFQPCFQ